MLARRLDSLDGWSAFRLGSPSTGLPDIVAVSSRVDRMLVIEAKSGTAVRLTVPPEQIERCVAWARAFGMYRNARIVLAFKFISKRRVGTGAYDTRELREYYKEWDASRRPVECVCLYDGSTYGRDRGDRVRLDLRECKMPCRPNGMRSG